MSCLEILPKRDDMGPAMCVWAEVGIGGTVGLGMR